MKAIVDLLKLPKDALALHYYGWDYLGHPVVDSHTSPEPCDYSMGYFAEDPNPCGFDTHYGDYFPARIGFDEALKGMQDLGVKVIPYTNGKMIDTNTEDWKHGLAQ